MKLTGFSRRTRGHETVPEPLSDQDAGISGTPRAGPEFDNLELEKRWLQLVRVDTEQFQTFYDRYHDPLFRFLVLRTDDADVAQDLTQDVFVYALEHLDRFTWQGYSFGAWLFHIARKRVLPRYWRSGRRKSEEFFLREQRADDQPAAAAESFERTELQARVRRLLARFADDRHDVFVLHVFMELSLHDTALAMGLPWETVRSHVRRGRLQLAEWLHDDQALTESERRCLSEELARAQGLKVAPEPRRRRAVPRADGERAAEGAGNDDDDDNDEGGKHHD